MLLSGRFFQYVLMKTAQDTQGALRSGPERAGDYGNPSAVKITIIVICIYSILAVALIPFAELPGPEIPGFVAIFTAGILITELSTAFFLFALFRHARTWSLLLLGCAYFYSSLMSLAQVLTFPGAILADQPLMIASRQSTAWIFATWVNGYALLTLIAVFMEARFSEARISRKNVRVATVAGLGAVLPAVLTISLVVVLKSDQLPLLISDLGFTVQSWVVRYLCIAFLYASIALIFFGMRQPSDLYLWLSWALTALVFYNVLAAVGGARYSIGWSSGRLSWLLSACAVFVYLLGQFARQQRKSIGQHDGPCDN